MKRVHISKSNFNVSFAFGDHKLPSTHFQLSHRTAFALFPELMVSSFLSMLYTFVLWSRNKTRKSNFGDLAEIFRFPFSLMVDGSNLNEHGQCVGG